MGRTAQNSASSIFSMSFDANHSIKRRRPRFRN
jgi:hypothetical protein